MDYKKVESIGELMLQYYNLFYLKLDREDVDKRVDRGINSLIFKTFKEDRKRFNLIFKKKKKLLKLKEKTENKKAKLTEKEIKKANKQSVKKV